MDNIDLNVSWYNLFSNELTENLMEEYYRDKDICVGNVIKERFPILGRFKLGVKFLVKFLNLTIEEYGLDVQYNSWILSNMFAISYRFPFCKKKYINHEKRDTYQKRQRVRYINYSRICPKSNR